MLNKLHKLREERREADKGFTLIELLVVVVIIGILIAIAIPLYLNYQKGAKNKSVQSDVRNAVSAVEQCITDNNGSLPAASDIDDGAESTAVTLTCGDDTETANVSDGNTLTITPGDDGTYTIEGTNKDTGKYYHYKSDEGKVASGQLSTGTGTGTGG